MKNFEFYNPTKLIFGTNTIKQVGEQISSRGYKHVLLIAGKGSIKNNGVYDQVIASLNDVKCTEIWGVQPNPTLAKANEAIKLAKDNQVDAILAVGGGSVIDTAKTVAAGFYLENVWDAYENKVVIEKALPLFVVLTISATGSEMNCGAVLTKEEEKKKWVIKAPCLFPQVSIIDPKVQKSLPWNQTVYGAIDALAHIIENYSLGTNEETTLALNESLMKTIIQVTDKLKQDESNYENRSNLAWAATLALNGTSGSMIGGGDWSSHMIEHGLSAENNSIAHGVGLAIIVPAWISYVWKENPSLFERWARNVWNVDDVNTAIEQMKQKFKQWEVPTSLTEIGIKEKQLDEIAQIVMKQGSIGSLKKLNNEDVLNILKIAF